MEQKLRDKGRSADLLLDAVEKATHAYAVARRLVYDVLPPGPVEEHTLNPRQAGAMEALRRAEAELEQLRSKAYRTSARRLAG